MTKKDQRKRGMLFLHFLREREHVLHQKIGSAAREDMEWLLGVKVNLQLWVKIKDDWRNRQTVLNELGYEG